MRRGAVGVREKARTLWHYGSFGQQNSGTPRAGVVAVQASR
jgi:hypothetical protein